MREESAQLSRRERRAAQRRSGAAVPRWVPRTALLTALATATIGVPLGQHAADAAGAEPEVATVAVEVDAGLPTALEVLSQPQPLPPTSLLAGAPDAERVVEAASRSLDRTPLPGCDGQARPMSENGQVPASDLCVLWDGEHSLRGDAAVALTELNVLYRAQFGRDLCITDSYRTLAVQRRLAYTKPGLAATPGKSNHGWGLAIDLCPSETGNPAAMEWLRGIAGTYGWINPEWAQRGGSGPYEPWHWEYLPGTTEMGSNW